MPMLSYRCNARISITAPIGNSTIPTNGHADPQHSRTNRILQSTFAVWIGSVSLVPLETVRAQTYTETLKTLK